MSVSTRATSCIRSIRRLLRPLRREVRLRFLKVGYNKWLTQLSNDASAELPAAERSLGPAIADGGRKPRVLFLADDPQWAQDRTARAISGRLNDEFEFRIVYQAQNPDLSQWEFDLIYVLFWGEVYQNKYVKDPRRVIKQISSHRWATERKYGCLSAGEAAYIYLRDAGTVTTPSRRLQAIFSPYRQVFLTQKGFEPEEFKVLGPRSGKLRIGWAGDTRDRCKGLHDILRPAVGSEFELIVAGGDLGLNDMLAFYNSVDVICVASTAEGDPLTLIEGMACGCYPVAVDVGIVPELVRHGENGLIVERKPAAFRAAFEWCAMNVGQVREAGLRNAEQMLQTRTWDKVSAQWREALRYAFNKMTSAPAVDESSPPLGGSD